MTNLNQTLMRSEALFSPQVIEKILAEDNAVYQELIVHFKQQKLTSLATIARGSSDHASAFLAYLIMARLGLPVTSIPMSLVTLYHAQLGSPQITAFAYSQSGQSPDLISTLQSFRDNGSPTVAVVNEINSPLAKASRWVLPLHCGAEKSVAATKSFIAQMTVGAKIIAHWLDDKLLINALNHLPAAMDKAGKIVWEPLITDLLQVDRLCVLSRGASQAIAMEASLKFKETCGIQAEAFSGAEFKHGPMGLVNKGYPILVLAPRGPAQEMLINIALEMRQRGGKVYLATSPDHINCDLPIVETKHPELDAICAILTFYLTVEQLARARNLDPDRPINLAKVTMTS